MLILIYLETSPLSSSLWKYWRSFFSTQADNKRSIQYKRIATPAVIDIDLVRMYVPTHIIMHDTNILIDIFLNIPIVLSF